MNPSNRTLSMMSPKVRQSIMAVSVVTALGLHAGEYVRIGDQWKTTSEYQEYLKKGGDNSPEGKAIKEKTITRLTDDGKARYIAGFDPRFQSLMTKRVNELPIGLQGLLVDMHGKITDKLDKPYDIMTMSRIQTFEFNFVDSIYRNNILATKSVEDILKIAPELDKTEIVATLREVGGKYDNIAKVQEETAKVQEDAEAWKRIGEILKAIK